MRLLRIALVGAGLALLLLGLELGRVRRGTLRGGWVFPGTIVALGEPQGMGGPPRPLVDFVGPDGQRIRFQDGPPVDVGEVPPGTSVREHFVGRRVEVVCEPGDYTTAAIRSWRFDAPPFLSGFLGLLLVLAGIGWSLRGILRPATVAPSVRGHLLDRLDDGRWHGSSAVGLDRRLVTEGEPFSLEWGRAGRAPAIERGQVTFRCLDWFAPAAETPGDGSSRTTPQPRGERTAIVAWEEVQPFGVAAEVRRVEVRARLPADLPRAAPPSGAGVSYLGRDYTVRFTGACGGPDYAAEFRLPVVGLDPRDLA